MMEDRQMILVIINFRKSNKNSQGHQAGAYWLDGKKSHV